MLRPSRIAILLIVIAIVGTGFAVAKLLRGRDALPYECAVVVLPEKVDIKVYGRNFEAEVARSDAEKQQGLSGRYCLKTGTAMLFPYDTPGNYCYWMKDMKFPIDMIWLDNEKKVITIEPNVSPDTYPKSFCPAQPAQYVIETEASVAEKQGWRVGTQFEF